MLIWSKLIHIHKYENSCSKLGRYIRRYIGFIKKDESLCADDGRERDHTLLPISCLLSSIIVDSELHGLYYNASFAHLTKEETAADINASAMKEGPDNELEEPQ